MNELELFVMKLEELEKRISFIKTLGGGEGVDLSDIERSIANINSKLSSAIYSISGIENSVSGFSGQINTLQNSAYETTQKLNGFEISINEFSNQIDAFENSANEITERLSSVEKSIGEFSVELMQELANDISTLELEVDELREFFVLLDGGISSALSQLKESNLRIENSNSRIEEELISIKLDIAQIKDKLMLIDIQPEPGPGGDEDDAEMDEPEPELPEVRTFSHASADFIVISANKSPLIGCLAGMAPNSDITINYQAHCATSAVATNRRFSFSNKGFFIPPNEYLDTPDMMNIEVDITRTFTIADDNVAIRLDFQASDPNPTTFSNYRFTATAKNLVLLNRARNYFGINIDDSVYISKSNQKRKWYARAIDNQSINFIELPEHDYGFAHTPNLVFPLPNVEFDENGKIIVDHSDIRFYYHCSRHICWNPYENFRNSPISSTISEDPILSMPCFGHFEGNAVCAAGIQCEYRPFATNTPSNKGIFTLNGELFEGCYGDCVAVQKRKLAGTGVFEPGYIVNKMNGTLYYVDKREATYMSEIGKGTSAMAYLNDDDSITVYYQNIAKTKIVKKVLVLENGKYVPDESKTRQINSQTEAYQGFNGALYLGEEFTVLEKPEWKIPYKK